jgi:hypothetical protein
VRLNGWQRVGIAASVVWAIGAPIYMDNAALRDADKWWGLVYDSCRDVRLIVLVAEPRGRWNCFLCSMVAGVMGGPR